MSDSGRDEGRRSNGDDLAELFGLEEHEQDTPPGNRPGVLPEPLIITKDPKSGVPSPKMPDQRPADPEASNAAIEAMRAGAQALGVDINYEARVGASDSKTDWEQTVDQYLVVLQRKGSEDQSEQLRLRLTTDPAIEAQDRGRIANLIRQTFLERDAGAGEATFAKLIDALYNEVIGLSILAPLWRDPKVTEILVDGWDEIYYEKDGELHTTDLRFRSPQHLETVARNLAETVSDRALSKTNPLVTARLPDARVGFVYGDVAGEARAYITIRKHHEKLTWEDLLAYGTMTPQMRDFLAECVAARVNILISGGTGAGKTTVINAVSSFIPDDERVITIEDSYELELRNRYWVKLQAKQRASADDKVEVTVSDLLKQTLRMRPDRIVVGEVRDGAAAAALLEASNTGHDGTLTTLHANSDWDAINARLPSLYQVYLGSSLDVARSEVSRAFELVVHVARRKGRRYVSAISEIGDMDRINGEIFLRRLYDGRLDPQGQPAFRHLANPVADGDLARKFDEADIDIEVGNLPPQDAPTEKSTAASEEPSYTHPGSPEESGEQTQPGTDHTAEVSSENPPGQDLPAGWPELLGADANEEDSPPTQQPPTQQQPPTSGEQS